MEPARYDKYRDILLETIFHEVKEETRDGKITMAKVLSVHDGDTLDVGIYESNTSTPNTLRIRLYGCDAPEVIPKKKTKNRELHKKAGLIVRDILIEELKKTDNIIWIRFTKREKFGREMGYLYKYTNDVSAIEHLKAQSMNDWLIDNKLAKPYGGSAKEEYTLEELTYIIDNYEKK